MAEQHRSRGFTRADALVAGVICLVLVLLVPIVQAMTEAHYIRSTCGNNLSQIGRMMLIYANDYDDELPRAGGPTSLYGALGNWTAPNRYLAYGLAADGSGGKATINSCFYLLVKYVEATPKLFVCGGDKGTTEFKLSDVWGLASGFELIDAWDFGPSGTGGTSWKSCSYSYHLPFGSPYALTLYDDPNLAVAADRNPWMKSPASDAAAWVFFTPDLPPYGGNEESGRAGNAISHGLDGQNVLFLDGQVRFETRSWCGVEQDNIYAVGTTDGGHPKGVMPALGSMPLSETDSLLFHDPSTFGSNKR
ncbi:MAG: hypothetical protein ABFD90_00380 [Phycisphaerales bacterium]